MGMRVLVLGSGGREDAIVRCVIVSPHVDEVFVAPGNGGTARLENVYNVALDIEDAFAVTSFAEQNGIDLVVIGPEAPLVSGVADAVRAASIPCFGPGADGARIEGSKAFAKDIMEFHGIPTGRSQVFGEGQHGDALLLLEEWGAPVVVKADGLAAGKGVTVAMEIEEAIAAVNECYEGRFGEAGEHVLIEEFLDGPECSLLAFVSGRTMLPMAPAQDHKRVGDGDTGPNTGGMGVYSPVPLVTDEEYAAMLEIMQASADAIAEEGIDYRGVLYGGFILTADGPKVLEFNARFGDPETQVVLPRLRSDLVEVLLATANGTLDELELAWSDDVGVSVVVASGGYPGSYETGKPITGIEAAEEVAGVHVIHAGTRLEGDTLVTAGGRVLNVTAFAPDFESAIAAAYEACGRISFEGAFYRHDIGQRALSARR
ncbi:MAG TPA: phosphoribosylamine--glycine ligase [Coriobacteriia bacterium]|nr:phosphoribosylamine--glycine ligase [Coriobacteriia bacterium]